MYVQLGSESADPDQIYLNDGDGQFTPGPEMPAVGEGGGDTVGALPDWRGSGRAAFIVNNGYQETPGLDRCSTWQRTDRSRYLADRLTGFALGASCS